MEAAYSFDVLPLKSVMFKKSFHDNNLGKTSTRHTDIVKGIIFTSFKPFISQQQCNGHACNLNLQIRANLTIDQCRFVSKNF